MANHTWFKHYPKGIPHTINPDEYSSLAELFQVGFEKYSHLPAMENMGKCLSYQELNSAVDLFASYLQNHTSLKKGDRIAIQMPNLLQYPVAMFAALKCGLVVVNTNPLYTPEEMKHQFIDSGAKAIVILENFACNLEQILPQTSIEIIITTEIGDLLGGLKKHITNFVVKRIKGMVPSFSLPSAISFNQALKLGESTSFQKITLSGDEIAFLQYTGGTTGVSKGAMLTHRNLIANLEQVCAWMSIMLEEGKETVITALPLYHVFALTCNCLVMFKLGAKNVLITNPRDMPGFVKELSKHPFSIITGVNTLFNGLLNQEKFAAIDFSKLKVAFGGGMAVQQIVAEKWLKITGSPLAEGYGLTETAPVLTTNPLDGTDRVGTIGLPIPSTEIKMLDDDGNEVAQGEPGELCAKGPQVMKGYWNRPEDTAQVMDGEWFKTGDIATIDSDGFIRIVDRKKEMILVSGFNVYPNEIEDAIAKHEKVLEVGAIGVPDAKSTEAVKIFIVKKDESLTVEEIKAHAHKILTGYKCPKHVEFTKELPKSNVGKILRRVLKEQDAKVNAYE
ncbi:AMP-binding protein [Reichenbachiella carrageenanivorans]|uniref:Long-chain-fatty-acid--CoA ligase n=1 Tax=Reichenbachiella carrageenanivorans TaxID=2979869 RepID=A0ABY6D2M3_9BACT|nr:AMP-binding protein [Reichenbachiella carrageenanivorans]UXX79999.1 AMP-binding protein [Reichenbachiella carrageenanivorans]